MTLDPKLVTPREKTLFKIGVVFSAICWLLLLITLVGGPYALIIFAFVLIGHALFLANVRGNGLRLSEHQLPELYERSQKAAQKLGLKVMPEVYVLQSGGILNAFATKLLSRKFVIVYSGLVANCDDPRELDFVIGHEMGHLAAGHLAWNAFLMPFLLCPWLGAAYMRAREYTCDRCGYAVVGELLPSQRALVVLAAGGKLASQVDLGTFAEQRRQAGHFWMATLELVSSHPYLCKRVAALSELATPGSVPVVARNPLAYPLAPFFGIMAGSAGSAAILVIVATVGILAAVAIPAFKKYQAAAEGLDPNTAQMQMLLDQLKQGAGPDESDPSDAVPPDDAEAPEPGADAPSPPAPTPAPARRNH